MFLTLILGLAAFALATVGLHIFLKPTILRIAVGPPDSDDEKLIKALAESFTKNRNTIRLEPVVTAGATESLKLFAEKNVDLAVARSDFDMPRYAEMVAIVRRDFAVLWSPTSAVEGKRGHAITSIDDLQGRTIGILGRTQADVGLLRVVLTLSGVNPETVEIKQYATSEINQMARDESLDAFMTVGPTNSAITISALEATASLRRPPKFLPIEVSAAIEQKHRVYQSEEIPGSMFKASPAWPENKLETISVSHVIVAQKSLSETVIASLTRQLVSSRHTLGRDTPAAAQIRKPDTDKDAALPVHRGAAAYVDGTEQTFLDRYSDYIWFALLGLSGVSSAVAWLRKFLMRDEWEGLDAFRSKVSELTKRARTAESVSALETLYREAGALMNDFLDYYDDGIIESDDIVALNLSLQQFNHVSIMQQLKIGLDRAE